MPSLSPRRPLVVLALIIVMAAIFLVDTVTDYAVAAACFYAAVIPKFITAAVKDEAPTIFGDGKQSRDFTFIQNVVNANLLSCTAPSKCAGKVMNIACGERIDLVELSEIIRRIVGRGKPPIHEPERAGDVKHSLADVSLARELIGYEPTVKFAEGIARTVQFYRSKPIA